MWYCYSCNHCWYIWFIFSFISSIFLKRICLPDSLIITQDLNSERWLSVCSFLTVWLKLFAMAFSSFFSWIISDKKSSADWLRYVITTGLWSDVLRMYSLILLQVVFLNSLETCFNSSGLYRTVIRQERFDTSSFFLFTSHNFVCYTFNTSLLYPKRLRSERARFQLLSDNCTSCRLQISNLNFSNFIM